MRSSVGSESSVGREQVDFNISYSDTPLKLRVLLTVMLAVCSTFLSSTVVNPYIPFLVEEFNPKLLQTNLGTKSGILAAVFYAGLICGGFCWSRLTAKFGRRPVLVAGLFLSGTLALGFGFTKNYWLAVVVRLLWGVSNSYISIAKRVLSEVTEKTNSAHASTIFSLGSISGKLMGYAVGGLLAQPADKYDWLDYSFFRSYPFALPVFFAAGFNLFSAMLVLCFLPETFKRRVQSTSTMVRKSQATAVQSSNEPLLPGSEDKMPAISLCRIIFSRPVACTVLPVLVTTISHASFNVVFPLWVLLPSKQRGFDFSTTDIGIARVLTFPTDLLLELVVYRWLVENLGQLCCYRIATVLWVITFAVMPFAYMTDKGTTETIWVAIYFVVVMNNTWGCVVSRSGGIMSANSIETRFRARVMRIRQLLIGLGGVFGSLFGGMLFSWGISSDTRSGYLKKFPFNFFCVWVFMAILTSILTITSLCLPDSIEFTPGEWSKMQKWKEINSKRSFTSLDESYVSKNYEASNADKYSAISSKCISLPPNPII